MRATQLQLQDDTFPRIFDVAGHRYIAHHPKKGFELATQISRIRAPYITVIRLESDCVCVEEAWLRQTIAQYEQIDDVFRQDFLGGVLFTGSPEATVTTGAKRFLHSVKSLWVEVHNTPDRSLDPLPGPYYVSGQQISEAWRLYDDSKGAFLTSLVPGPEKSFTELKIVGKDMQTISVAVPSRLKYTLNSTKPLAGWRIAVKDIYKVRGIKTSVCNRAYYTLYPPAARTASCIQLLLAESACVLGTTKLAAFAATEEPVECVDYQAPWNPRADGYQSPAGSSSGSGVAIAAYEWLDVSIGSDTSGSGRRPGHWNGCYAMRPSHGVLPVEGYIPSFEQFDTPTFYARSVDLCKNFANIWYGSNLPKTLRSLPPRIVYPTEYMSLITNQDQLKIIHDFMSDLEKSMGIEHEKISFDELWDADPPQEAGEMGLQEWMRDACRNSFFHDDYHNFSKFRKDYEHKFGKAPYVSPPVRWQWNLAATITKEQRDIAVFRLEVYSRWVTEKVMRSATNNTIILIPIENISPRYRDEPLGRYFNPIGVPMLFLSPILKAPEFTVPIGQVPFESKVSGRTEHLPVAISLLASQGRDLEIIDIANECLLNAGRPTSVLAGSRLFA